MQQTILPQSNEPLPLFNDFINSISQENKMIEDSLSKTIYQFNLSEPANLFFTQSSSWEYFKNELEFE